MIIKNTQIKNIKNCKKNLIKNTSIKNSKRINTILITTFNHANCFNSLQHLTILALYYFKVENKLLDKILPLLF